MAHIRAKRGTVSALTADADEFGTMRAQPGARWNDQLAGAGAEIGADAKSRGAGLRCSGEDGFQGRNEPTRPLRLDTYGFLIAGSEPSTVTVRVQFSDRSFDRATKRRPHFNSESQIIARLFCKLFASIAKTFITDRMQSNRMHCQIERSANVQRTFSQHSVIIPSSAHHRSGIRSHASRRSSALF